VLSGLVSANPGGEGEAPAGGAPAPPGEGVIELREVTKGFGPTVAVRDLSLSLRGGEVVALVGENGAGKSTLLKTLGGEYRPDFGQLLVDGEEVSFSSPAAAHAAGIRIVAQEPEIVPGVSIAENVYLGALPRHRGWVDARHLRGSLEEMLRRHGFEGTLPLSGLGAELTPAQRQVVEIMRAVRPGLRLVAFDEPTSSLTEEEVERLFLLIRRLREEGVAVLYISHRMKEIFELADRIVVLRDGTYQGERAVGETDEAELVRMMVGRKISSVMRSADRVPKIGDVVLEVSGLTSHWHRDVDLQVRAGEVVALAGLVGAGRSELARIVFGDLPATAGAVAIEGETVSNRTPVEMMRRGVGFTPEERKAEALFMSRSVRENISIASVAELRRGPFVDGRRERRLSEDYIDSLGIATPSAEAAVETLSGGNQQKVVVARWLARRPRLLILDEPTRGIDVGVKADLYRLIEQMADEGVAILLISSEMLEVLGLADRVVVMRSGRIAGELTRTDASEERVLRLAIPEYESVAPEGGSDA
jgi:L-arabinose transport system ATP-binding protein